MDNDIGWWQTMSKENVIIIDATNLILGRLASNVAKRLLSGENVVIVNSEKAIISGNKRSIIEDYKKRLHRKSIVAPWEGPFQPRRPDMLLKRTVRGMLPYKAPKGRMAYKRLRVFIGVPEEYKERNMISIPEANSAKLKNKFITLAELCNEIGGFKV